MRRPSSVVVLARLVLVAGGCRGDGRTLRPAGSNQHQSISVPTTPTTDPSEDTGDEAADPDAASSFGVIGPWADSGAIPVTYTCDGANTSPALTWGDIPAGTAEIAVSLTDDDAPDFMHWVVVGLPGTATSINENATPVGALVGTNSNGATGYTGPCPPAGETHTYRYSVHFLDQQIEATSGDDDAALLDSISLAEIDSIDLVGTYSRPGSGGTGGTGGTGDTINTADTAD